MVGQRTLQRKNSKVRLLKNPGMSSCVNVHSTGRGGEGGEVKMAAHSELPSLSPDSSPQPPSSVVFQSIHRSLTLSLRTGFPPPLHPPFVHDSSLPSPVHTFIPQSSLGQGEEWVQRLSRILNWDISFIYQYKCPKEATEKCKIYAFDNCLNSWMYVTLKSETRNNRLKHLKHAAEYLMTY